MQKKINNKEVELKVCKDCDAPLPFNPKELSYFNKDNEICDECLNLKKG
tara:strand:+ start:294 stop:440 length:147 start_codon:yes stop_codon:yes gene_type:complete